MVISIIVPIYNCEKWLKTCIDSLLSQDSPCRLEIILVDDGSTDNSGRICDEYAIKQHYIKVLHTKNKGVSCARNIGLDTATGDWIMFVDGDDVLKENAINVLYNQAQFYRYDSLRFGAYLFDNSKTESYKLSISTNRLEYLDLVVQRTAMLGVCGGIYKKSLFRDYKITFSPGIRTGEDWIVLFKLLCHSHSFFYFENDLYGYRINPDSVTRKKINYVRPDTLIALNIILDYAKCNNIVLNISSINKAKSDLRRKVMKAAILNHSKKIYKETESVLRTYLPQSLWADLYYSKRLKHKIGFLCYKILSIVYLKIL